MGRVCSVIKEKNQESSKEIPFILCKKGRGNGALKQARHWG